MSGVEEETGNLELRAPYASWDTFGPVLERIRKRSPTDIDAQVLQTWGLSKSSALKVLPALRFFRIIDAKGKPTQLWNRIAVQDPGAYREAIEAILSASYGKLLQAYPEAFKEPDERLADMIKEIYGGSPSTATPAVVLLKHLLSEAGLRQVSDGQVVRAPRPKLASRPKERRTEASQDKPAGSRTAQLGPNSQSSVTIHLHLTIGQNITEGELVDLLNKVTNAATRN